MLFKYFPYIWAENIVWSKRKATAQFREFWCNEGNAEQKIFYYTSM